MGGWKHRGEPVREILSNKRKHLTHIIWERQPDLIQHTVLDRKHGGAIS